MVESNGEDDKTDLQKLLTSPEVLKRMLETGKLLRRASQPDVIAVSEYIASLPADFSEISKRKLFMPLDECTIPFYVVDIEERERRKKEKTSEKRGRSGADVRGERDETREGYGKQEEYKREEETRPLSALEHIINNERTKNIAILGEPGDGKTVLMFKLAEEYSKRYVNLGKIPVYIDLSHYHGQGLMQLVLESIKFLDGLKADRDEMLKQGKFVFLLDGLDEAGKRYDELTRELSSIPSELSNNRFIVSCRKNEYKALHSFKEFELQKVTNAQLKEFLGILGKDKKYMGLLAKLMEEPSMSLWENRLLLGFLVRLYEQDRHEGREFSYKNEADLYERIINLFMQREEEKHGDKYIISRDANIKLLSEIAYEMQAVDKASRLSKERVEIVIERILPNDSAEFRARVYELIKENGLISYDKDTDTFSFIHRTLQEYLCARAINDRLEGKIVDKDEKQRVTTVRDAWVKLFSYEEDKELWGVGGRALRSAWETTLLFLGGMVDDENAQNLVEIIGESYIKAESWWRRQPYNPFETDYKFMLRLASRNKTVKTMLGQELINQLVRVGFNKNRVRILGYNKDKVKILGYLGELRYYDPKLRVFLRDDVCDDMIIATVDVLEKCRYYEPILVRLLETQCNGVKEAVANALGQIRYYDHRLVWLLEHEDSHTRLAAAKVLGQIGHYDPKLVELLDHQDDEVKIAAAEVLGQIRHYEPKLVELLSNRNTIVRKEAAKALGKIGHSEPQVTKKLIELLEDENEEVIDKAIFALAMIGHYDPKLLSLINFSGSNRFNLGVAIALQRIGGRCGKELEKIVELLEQGDDQMQSYAIRIRGDNKLYTPKLLDHLEDVRIIKREFAIDALRKMGFYGNRLIELLEDENDKKKFLVTKELAKKGCYDDVLRDLLRDDNILIRYIAREALKSIRHYDPRLIELLRDDNIFVKHAAADALGKIKDSAPALVELVVEKEGYVRVLAAQALAEIGHYDPRLVDILQKRDMLAGVEDSSFVTLALDDSIRFTKEVIEDKREEDSLIGIYIAKALAKSEYCDSGIITLLPKDYVIDSLQEIGQERTRARQIIKAIRKRHNLESNGYFRELVASIHTSLKPTGYGEPLKNAA